MGAAAEKRVSYLQMSELQTEITDTERKGEDYGALPTLWNRVYEEELTEAEGKVRRAGTIFFKL